MKKKLNCILLIDDDEPTNFLNSMIIEEADCTKCLKIVQSGEKALDYLLNRVFAENGEERFPCPDLIILDINMPAMNGWEFLEKYRTIDQCKKGKAIIIMLTTSLNPDDKLRAEGIREVMSFENKPITAEMLKRVLRGTFPSYF